MPAGFEFRREFAVEVMCCTCGDFSVTLVAAREITLTDVGWEEIGAVRYDLIKEDDLDCEMAEERRILMPTTERQLVDDVVQALQSIPREVSAKVRKEIEKQVRALLDDFLADDLDAFYVQN